jgi:hypothetical protein
MVPFKVAPDVRGVSTKFGQSRGLACALNYQHSFHASRVV